MGESDRAVLDPSGWYHDDSWAYLDVSGADRADFLKRLSTNAVPAEDDLALHSFFLSVNARVLAEFWLQAVPKGLQVICPRDHLEPFKDNIDRYHFGEDISVQAPEGALYLLGHEVPFADLPCEPWGASQRYDGLTLVFVPENNLAEFQSCLSGPEYSLDQLEQLRLDAGWARYGQDYDGETLFLEMAQEGDFSESKGCYPGQEIVARVLHRGRLNRSLRAFQSETAIPLGWTAKVEGKEVARVTTSVPDGTSSRGFLYVRREHGADGHVLSGSSSDGVESSLTIIARPGEIRRGED